MSADAVHGSGAECAHKTERNEEHPAVHCRLDAGVAYTDSALCEGRHLTVVATEQFDEQRTTHVETLGHLRVHLGVVFHLLASDCLQPLTDTLGRDDEDRKYHE